MKHLIKPLFSIAFVLLTLNCLCASCSDDDDDNPLVGTVWIEYIDKDEKYFYNDEPLSARLLYFTNDKVERYLVNTNNKIVARSVTTTYFVKNGRLYVGKYHNEIKWDHYQMNFDGIFTRSGLKFEDYLPR